jgi:hypothetical protein
VRRKFFDLHAANASPVAAQALRYVGLLYGIEQQATVKPNRFEPIAWLIETLKKLLACPNSQIDSLLPFPQSIPV